MRDWDLASINLVLVGSSITVASTIVSLMLLDFRITITFYLLLTIAVFIVMNTGLFMFSMSRIALLL